MRLVELRVSLLLADPRCQARVDFSEDYAEQLADYLVAGGTLPPVVAFRDSANLYWLADGFHRRHAHEIARRKTILVDVRAGEVRDAQLHAAGANRDHGLRRTNADKRRAVLLLLTDASWTLWPGRRIADHCGISEGLVRTLREQLEEARKTPANDAHGTQSATVLSVIATVAEARRVGGDGRAGRIDQADYLLARLCKLVAGLGCEAEVVLQLLGQAGAALHALPSE